MARSLLVRGVHVENGFSVGGEGGKISAANLPRFAPILPLERNYQGKTTESVPNLPLERSHQGKATESFMRDFFQFLLCLWSEATKSKATELFMHDFFRILLCL